MILRLLYFILKPSAFKTCYIAQVKEEMGFKVKRAHNRQADERKHKVPKHLREYIEKAIRLLKKQPVRATYRKIQQKAFELYRKQLETQVEVKEFRGIFKDSPDMVKKITEDEGLSYGT